MFGSSFYYSTIRRYVSYFGTLFNDIEISRISANGDILQTLKVPVSYGPKQKFIARIEAEPELKRPLGNLLPRIAFEMTSLMYDGTRKLTTTTKHYHVNDVTGERYQYVPVPYNIFFNLSIMVKNAEDGAKIIEQILPYFTPDWTDTLTLVPEMGDLGKFDIPVVLQNISVSDMYNGSFEDRRVIVWDIDFMMKCWFFGPTRSAKLIKKANTNIYNVPDGDTPIVDVSQAGIVRNVIITPGLLANGSPTSNSSLSIPYLNIDAEDDYGFCIDITEYQ